VERGVIAVVGAGGVGGYFGGKLASAGADVVFIARGATLEALRTRGLRVDSIGGDFVVERVNATDDPAGVGTVDAVIFAVKAWQIAEAAERVKPLIGPDTMVVPLENGMEVPEQLAAILGAEHVLGGLCGIVAYIVEPGHIRHAGIEPFVMFGEVDGRPSERAERLREEFVRAGVKADPPQDIRHAMWSKFLFITPMSGIGALTRVPIGVWRSMPQPRAIAAQAMREIIAVAAARGVTLGDEAVDRTLARYDGMPAEATSSLQRDVMEGKPSELDAQLGAVARMARAAGIDTPVCDFLLAMLLPQEHRLKPAPTL
jgi:2-dehydropantoate 2-reductase